MSLRSIVAWLLFALGLWTVVYSNQTWSLRKLERELEADVGSWDRYVDIGVTLCAVEHDPDGDELISGKPRMRVVRELTRHLGGILDTKSEPPMIVAPSRAGRVWYCSRDQYDVVLHLDDVALGQLVYGSEGSGKSTAIAMWLYCRWLEMIGEGRELGCVAPTKRRLKMVRDELVKLWSSDWYVFKKAAELLVLPDGTRIQFVSSKKQSTAGGSPLQGFNWSGAAQDELQDQDDEVHDDVGQRCRAAKHGRAKRIASCTAKDTAAFRNRRDRMLGSGEWVKRTMLIARSPFIAQAYVEQRRRELSAREFDRRFNALDLPPELATYPAWSRAQNVVESQPGWLDVTSKVLEHWGDNLAMLAGHDPGALCDVTLLLKAYARKNGIFWVVVDEITTEQTTTDQHATKLLSHVREHYGLHLLDRNGRPSENSKRVLMRVDPYGNSDSKPDRSTYTIFRNRGLVTHPAAYARDGVSSGRVPKNEGIEMVNTLLCNAAGERRLFVARNDRGELAAPHLVQAFEESERDERGRAETQRKDEKDLSHWPAALRYALWSVARPRLGQQETTA